MRMMVLASMDDSMAGFQTLVARWSKREVEEYNAALAWMEQEEDWEAVEKAWAKLKGGAA